MRNSGSHNAAFGLQNSCQSSFELRCNLSLRPWSSHMACCCAMHVAQYWNCDGAAEKLQLFQVASRLYYNWHAQHTARGSPQNLSLRPARAFSIVENVAKARPRISNCRSRISSILQQNLYIEMK